MRSKTSMPFEKWLVNWGIFVVRKWTWKSLVINKKLASYACVVHNMAAAKNFHTGRENILLVGEAGGFFRVLDEGISSALITGYAAGKSILKSMKTGRDAIDHYRDEVSSEIELCYALNCMVKEKLGINPCTR